VQRKMDRSILHSHTISLLPFPSLEYRFDLLDDIHSTVKVEGCCELCSSRPDCKAFTYVDGVCYMKDCNNAPDKTKMKGAVTGFL
jgi:hypothetical protein